MKYRLVYVQPRPHADNSTTVIYEKKEQVIEAATPADAQEALDRFMRQGAVTCGSATYVRTKITFMPLLAPTSCAAPDPSFIPPYDAN